VGTLNGPTPASLVIVTYESAIHLPHLLDALAADPAGAAEVIVVDNASGDNSAAIADSAGATVIRMTTNEGFAAACHVGADAASQPVLVFLNPDTVPHEGWLPPLVAAVEGSGVGAASSTIELATAPGHFNTSGGALTYYGVAWATDVGEPIGGGGDVVETPFPSGAAMAMTADMWRQMGGFRADFFLYQEDADLGWRLRMRGLRSVRVPASVVAHDYDFTRNPDKMFHLERNRLLMLRANYRTSTLVLLVPALLFVELGVLVIAVRDGWAGAKIRSWGAAWRGRKQNASWRRSIIRTVDDGAILATMETSPSGVTQMQVPLARFVGWLLAAYVRLVRLIV